MKKSGRSGQGWGCQGGCERKIEVIVKMKKKVIGGGGGGKGGQVGCEHEELNYCDNAKQVGGGMRTLLQNMSEKLKVFKWQ